MPCLIDTGVLLRAFDVGSPQYGPIRQAFRTLWRHQEQLFVASQNLAEFWNVSTRPTDRNGYGLSIDRVSKRLSVIEHICDVLTEDEVSVRLWKDLLLAHTVTGVAVHDARLVSVMLAHGIPRIVTLNVQDFRRYSGVTALLPAEV